MHVVRREQAMFHAFQPLSMRDQNSIQKRNLQKLAQNAEAEIVHGQTLRGPLHRHEMKSLRTLSVRECGAKL